MSMLQVPNSTGISLPITPSLPPSQTPTIVQMPRSSEDVNENAGVTAQPEETDVTPKVAITFLLLSGKRKTLEFEQNDSFAVVKERLVKDWPTEWQDETKPQTASTIRLLHLGREIADDECLSAKSRFQPRPNPPTIVHLSIRPFPIRTASTTGSLKRGALLRTGSGFSLTGRRNANASGQANQRTGGDGAQLDSVPEQNDSGCCCIIC